MALCEGGGGGGVNYLGLWPVGGLTSSTGGLRSREEDHDLLVEDGLSSLSRGVTLMNKVSGFATSI